MKSRIATTRDGQLEQLEPRRMLCGIGSAAGIGHLNSPDGPAAAVEHVLSRADAAQLSGEVSARFGDAVEGGARVVFGEATIIDGARLVTWALVSPRDDEVLAVGLTMPLKLIDDQPQQPGSGPRGAIASLDFPAAAQETTYFNHLELHTQPNGHQIAPQAVDPNRYRTPHFDFHFYNVPEAQVWTIPAQAPPLPPVPANRLPAGLVQPGPSELQMGRHAAPLTDMTTTGVFSQTMIAGFLPDASKMHFIEPMITRAKLLGRADFTLPVPIPQTFDLDTRYPTTFEAAFQGQAYHFVFSDFIDTVSASADRSGAPAPGAATLSKSPSFNSARQGENDGSIGRGGDHDDDDQQRVASEVLEDGSV